MIGVSKACDRSSRSQELSLYKYLLFVFIFNDLLYTIIHFIAHPVISIAGEVFYLYSANFPGPWVITIFGTSHSHSFLILGFHFIYRHIAVSSTDGNRLFREWWFIVLLVLIFIAESVVWFLIVFYLYATEADTFLEIYETLHTDYPEINSSESIMTAHYWCSVLGIVVYSSVSIFKFLHNNLSKSRRGLALQRQLYYTLLVQFCVPFFVMYVPVLFALFPPLLHIRFSFPRDLMPTMFSVYPSLDALVILFGVHDYRREVMAMFKCFYPALCKLLGDFQKRIYMSNGVVSFTTMSVQK
ncbi:hypothetical protein PRIPAC_80648 [Pristionchus pacificus]|uniref:G protein-coupled receptor n=1 Tax=Pristionchus pacificus TaxID=54126 RepID=A0A2A6BHA0_PRIPA|nr:hypothetical protein PRIPAC_80648 [Pristionchus pacificus]|eukprot:PDM65206.1 G protein-coupled receptor [Pristionchus pacificus]